MEAQILVQMMYAVKLVFSVLWLLFIVIFQSQIELLYKSQAYTVLFCTLYMFKVNNLCGSLLCRFNSPGIDHDGSKNCLFPASHPGAAAAALS